MAGEATLRASERGLRASEWGPA